MTDLKDKEQEEKESNRKVVQDRFNVAVVSVRVDSSGDGDLRGDEHQVGEAFVDFLRDQHLLLIFICPDQS